jgi:soluble lytic murein transglycosylase
MRIVSVQKIDMRAGKKQRFCLVAMSAILLSLPFNLAEAGIPPVPDMKPMRNVEVMGGNEAVSYLSGAGQPVPVDKPDFSLPDVTRLLTFGQKPPMPPKSRPIPPSGIELDNENALIYKKIFAYQSEGRIDKANELLSLLTDFRLRGHVLYQRYMHPTAYRATFEDLTNWMELYADHPGADNIYKLAIKRMPEGFAGHIKKYETGRGIKGLVAELDENGHDYVAPMKRRGWQTRSIRDLKRKIRNDLSKGMPSKALQRLQEDKAAGWMDQAEIDNVNGIIANSYMHYHKYTKALNLASESANRSGSKAPLAGWVAGLLHWRQGNYEEAARMFEYTALSPYASTWVASGGAYWAARSHARAGNSYNKDVKFWLERAAEKHRTFYGLIAAQALGQTPDFNWAIPSYSVAHKLRLRSLPSAQRAMDLAKAEQFHLAEKELRRIDTQDDPFLREAFMAYAQKEGLASLALRMAEAYTDPYGHVYDAGLYPLAQWEPKGGYEVDRALIHALVRQESRFNPNAESGSGATGLMQLMPSTAGWIAGSKRYKSRQGRHALKSPEVNLDIGQRYVQHLMGNGAVNADLFSMAIAYNAGPGNLRKWKRELSGMVNDPLLFIECLPVAETRIFVERVMANYWIYRMRLGQETPSLAAIAAGEPARYVQLDSPRKRADLRAPVVPAMKPYRIAQN